MAIYQFALQNVRCAGCVRSIEKALAGSAGVAEFSINFADRTATVQTDLAPEAVVQLIEAAGFGAELIEDEADYDRRSEQEAAHYRTTLGRALIALAVGALLMGLMLSGAMPEPTSAKGLIGGAVSRPGHAGGVVFLCRPHLSGRLERAAPRPVQYGYADRAGHRYRLALLHTAAAGAGLGTTVAAAAGPASLLRSLGDDHRFYPAGAGAGSPLSRQYRQGAAQPA